MSSFVSGLARLAGLLLVVLATHAAGAPKILHVGNGVDPQTLDPHLLTGIPEGRISRALNEGLVRTDADLNIVPAVAQSWEVSPDGRTYTFHLRPDARWSNGAPVTARDFVRSYERVLSPALGAQYAENFQVVIGAEDFHRGTLGNFGQVGIRATDDRTLQFRLQQPATFFLYFLTRTEFAPVPMDVVTKHGPATSPVNRWTNPGNYVGNGAFQLQSSRNGQKVVVVRSPTYWDRANVKLDEIHFYPIENAVVEERMFRTGQLHLTQGVPLSKISTYRRELPAALHIDPYGGLYYYAFNTRRAPFTDVRVRRALALAIDRESLVERVTLGAEIPAYHAVPPGLQGYESTAAFKADLTTARELLAAAGFPGGQGLPSIELLYNTAENHRAVAETLQQMWHKNLGVSVTLVNQEWKVYLDTMQKSRAFQIIRAGWTSAEPQIHLERWTTGHASNVTQWSNAEYDRLARAAIAAPTNAGRYACYQQMEKILNDEMPIMPIYFQTLPRLISPKVIGYHTTMDDTYPWKDVDLAP